MTDLLSQLSSIAASVPGAQMVGGVPILPSNLQAPSTQAQMFGNQIPGKSGVLQEFHTNQLVSADVAIESRLCTKIVNKKTGHEWDRDLSPNGHWDVLYGRALMHPEEFEVLMEAESRRVVEFEGDHGNERRPVFSVADLKALGKGKLDEIGRMYGVRDTRKPNLIIKIINAQAELVSQVRADQISDKLVAPIRGLSDNASDTQLTAAAAELEDSFNSEEKVAFVPPVVEAPAPPVKKLPFGRKA